MAQTENTNRLKFRLRKTILYLLLLLPLWSFLFWWLSPSTPLKVVMLDKTAQDFSNIEHRAFTWVLNHNHFVKEDGSHYDRRTDYLGHFPQPGNILRSKYLTALKQTQIDSIADYVDLGYFIDTYGSTYEEWGERSSEPNRKGLVYGGLEAEDASLMQSLQERDKLIIAEFSIFGAPTPLPIRRRAENLLGVHFSGWVGRYWQELSPDDNGELPDWIPELYKKQYQKEYEFKGPGLGFFHEDGRILILPEDLLVHNVPILETNGDVAEKMGLDPYIRYPFWFEICTPDTAVRTLSQFRIYAGATGLTQMRAFGIPTSFPAVLIQPDWKTIYLAGDFTDNPVSLRTSRFAGIRHVRSFFYDNQNPEDRKKFFWEWYEPFISQVLTSYVENSEKPELPPPPPSLYEVTLALILNKEEDLPNWNDIPDPRMIEYRNDTLESDSTIYFRLNPEVPTHFVRLASFPREYHTDMFIKEERLVYANPHYNVLTGGYEVVIPCYSEETAWKIKNLSKERYRNVEIIHAN